MLTARKLRSGRWAIYKGRVRYLTPSYATQAQAQERIDVEHKWQGASFSIHYHAAVAKVGGK